MPPQETGKFRATRIPLDYYKRPDLLSRWKGRFVVLALVAAIGGVSAASLLRSDQGAAFVSRGPVAAVHATWDDNCEACHTSFRPISGEAWLGHALTPGPGSSAKCTTCHAGPPHHAAEKPGDVADCAACHHEHRGRDTSLVRVADDDCTRCHANLAAHTQKSQPEFAAAVTRFDEDHHPEFKLAAPGPGNLKFNHKQHLAAGLDCKFTLAQIDPTARSWFATQQAEPQPNALVQLSCESCHRLDRQDLPKVQGQPGSPLQRSLVPPRNAGAYFLPISYEGQCAACHPLTIERKNPDDPRSGHLAVPHRLQPQDLRDYLVGHYTAAYLEGNVKLFEQVVTVRRFPGKLPAEETEPARKLIEKKVNSVMEDVLFNRKTCLECHYGEGEAGKVVPRTILPTDVPVVWFPHARFDHTAHRAVSCAACHALAEAKEDRPPEHKVDMQIPGRDTCVQCHAPAAAGSGGARFDCAECHRYHNGDAPLQGVGAAARGVPDDRTMDMHQFLRGGR
jgi:hypothetical protein